MTHTGNDDLVGQMLGSYRIESRLGAGGMGEVFRALHVNLHRQVAIKTLRPEVAADPSLVERFFSEAKAVNLIRHENIIECTDLIAVPGGLSYIVMELLEGRTLTQAIRDSERLSLVRTAYIGAQVADALYAAHQTGIIHRDLKPDNVFLIRRAGTDDYVKVLDFGVASLRPDLTKVKATQTGAVIGTPAYMSPEQCEGKRVTPAADIYALGVLLFQMLTGQLPFDGPTMPMMLVAHLTSAPPSVHSLAPDVSPAMSELVAQMLAKQPEHRPESMAVVRQTLLELGGISGMAPAAQGAAHAYHGAAGSGYDTAPEVRTRGTILHGTPAPPSSAPTVHGHSTPPSSAPDKTARARPIGAGERRGGQTGAGGDTAAAHSAGSSQHGASAGDDSGALHAQLTRDLKGQADDDFSGYSTSGQVAAARDDDISAPVQGTPVPAHQAPAHAHGTPAPASPHVSAAMIDSVAENHPDGAALVDTGAGKGSSSTIARPAMPTTVPAKPGAPTPSPTGGRGRLYGLLGLGAGLIAVAAAVGLWLSDDHGGADPGLDGGVAVGLSDAATPGEDSGLASAERVAALRAALDSASAAHGEPAAPTECQTDDLQLLERLSKSASLLQDGTPDGGRDSDIEAVRILAGEGSDTAEYWHWLAKARLYAEANVAAVATAAEQAIARCDNYAAAHNVLGSALFRDQPEQAMVAYQRAVTLDPGFNSARFNLGLAQMQTQQTEAGVASLTEVIERAPELFHPEALLARSQAYLKLGRAKDAIADLERVTAASPDHAVGFFLLGQAHRLDRADAEAHEAMCKARALGYQPAFEHCPQ
ncbi:MAG: hypothetical protein Tsb0020_23150 [Haliangiales bacterium]